jgi:hypothetical protein
VEGAVTPEGFVSRIKTVIPQPTYPKFNLGTYQKARRRLVPTAKKPLFMVDLDSTIYDMDGVLQDCVKVITGVKPAPATTWECEVAWGLSRAEAGKVWELLWNRDIPPFPGAYKFLNRLRQKFTVVSLSTRKLGEARNHGLAMTEDLPVDKKIWTSSPEEKAKYLKRDGAMFFLDDSPANHLAAADVGVITDLLLLDKPWNQSQDINPVWKRVFSYEEVLSIALE